ncbi:cytochrome b561 [Rhizobium sp. BK181]|uniref:cytochrome b n=1 Tax=Rhizobium sp. BK181 TaxID=2587072 RepID=UPI00161491DF|nr:cytochrome b/b6 domain-containing protein [Rhizobium sp. BK181]MBB3319761.1 cytochrome b561 [Rhizobium sp. BK181]
MRKGYRGYQIALHWVIAGLLPIQYLTGGSIERTHHAVHMGVQPSATDVLQHLIHNYAGLVIGGLMVLRLLLRIMQPPTRATPLTRADLLATALHIAFYTAIIGQAALGFVASYLTFSVAPLHVIGSNVILMMVAIHFTAAAWHTLIKRDATIDRIILPRTDEPAT